eukprot:2551239-Amphidinium_carterae.1
MCVQALAALAASSSKPESAKGVGMGGKLEWHPAASLRCMAEHDLASHAVAASAFLFRQRSFSQALKFDVNF